MRISTIKLFALVILVFISSIAKADSFSLDLNSKACSKIEGHQNKSDARLNAYDKAMLLAVKSSEYIKSKNLKINDYDYSLLSYKIADRAIKNVIISTTHESNKKICLELKASLDKQKADMILKDYSNPNISAEKVKEIADNVNQTLPKSIYEANDSIPLFYVYPLEFYTKKTTSDYTSRITEQLSFMPRILITDNKELADYYILPRLEKSSLDIIDEKYTENLSVENIANLLYVSPSTLSHKFSKELNISVYQYITKKRLSVAHELIWQGESLKNAALDSGFNDYSCFYRLYRKYYK